MPWNTRMGFECGVLYMKETQNRYLFYVGFQFELQYIYCFIWK